MSGATEEVVYLRGLAARLRVIALSDAARIEADLADQLMAMAAEASRRADRIAAAQPPDR